MLIASTLILQSIFLVCSANSTNAIVATPLPQVSSPHTSGSDSNDVPVNPPEHDPAEQNSPMPEVDATAPSSSASPAKPTPKAASESSAPLPKQLVELLQGTTPLNPQNTVFADVPGRRVILKTEVACRTCVLEMLCVPEGIKEHETILRVKSRAYVIHTGLLALGMEPGKAVQFSPEFRAPSGSRISIYAAWIDQDGKMQRKDVRTWIRHNVHRYYAAAMAAPPPNLKLPYKELRYDKFNHEILWYGPMNAEQRDDLLTKWDNPAYQKAIHQFFSDSQSRPMTADFVFVGSQFYTDPESGRQMYQAEGGYLICVANFADAMIDIREQSSANDGAQTYEAWTDHVPPEGTAVLLELVAVEAESEKAPTSSAPGPRQ